jgi:hypothetical protein
MGEALMDREDINLALCLSRKSQGYSADSKQDERTRPEQRSFVKGRAVPCLGNRRPRSMRLDAYLLCG